MIMMLSGRICFDKALNSLERLHGNLYALNESIWASAWDFQQCGMCNQQSLKSACAYAQSDQSLCSSLEYSSIVKLLTEHHLEFLSLKGGCRGSTESRHVKMSNCWKSHAPSHLLPLHRLLYLYRYLSQVSDPTNIYMVWKNNTYI